MHQTDACQFCEAPALIGFGRAGSQRLTLIYWTCQRCKRNNVSTWDWQLHELAACAVIRTPSDARNRAEDFLRQHAQKQRRQQR